MAEPAAQPALRRTVLQKNDVPGSNYETILGISELAPNAAIARESHPGLEAGYVLEGSATLSVDGQPSLHLTPGLSWKLASRAVHEFRAGPQGVKVLATWVVAKGEPFTQPAN